MPRVFSGVQPTNNLHLGNYLGAIKNWVELQNNYDCFYCVVDLHALTVRQDPETLRQNTINTAKTYIALGVDPNKSTIFVQSQVPAHAEMAWLLNTIAKLAELERMTQFKDKSIQHKNNINLGLFAYPVLMATDILLYDANLVPVGEDQKQHIELTRALAERFNNLFGQAFVIPEPLIKKDGARIMGLDDSTKKMSKSAPSPNNYISLLDSPEIARKKIMKAMTDSGNQIKSGHDKPALTNLLTIYSLLNGRPIKELEKQYQDSGYGDFKSGLADEVIKFLNNFQTKFAQTDDKKIKDILDKGANKARAIANQKLSEVKNKMGLV
ncbi:MAG: tryptophan--tRNA ligase [Candidatus Magasanikbacteria bacterium CG10_big_fil_rev_8_21_14_0_10_40_10]|uniref:Tryptophan--tRNA ligase n=1 Tax=Candidatus Magasanikbacteria bacterium CG10_big_fil_rev_8_21_14_0_10_40_10 TaxID=1974648 RepID=A0A2M6W3S3_9BACT|nr:MAG: tryptophan--tRNA ligase [Candidatus Magasanikbacteria bacterium CG10_big_fil_rev_8_21_14_0_10_40_10]